MRTHLRYGVYVARHKWFVFRAGLKLGVPLWRLIIHDWSKLTPTEWGGYARRFYGGRGGLLDNSADPEEFHRAWTHHWHRNPHHWEHWLAITYDGELRPMLMPETYVREMVADWMGAGRAITGRVDIIPWYTKNAERMNLHPDVRQQVENLLKPYSCG